MKASDKIHEVLLDICREVLDDHAMESWQLEEWLDNNTKWRELREYIDGDNVEFDMNMRVKDLKTILNRIENEDMEIVIPVLDTHDKHYMYGFRHVRTAGILANRYEEHDVLCLSAPDGGMDIDSQLKYCNMTDTVCKQGLF